MAKRINWWRVFRNNLAGAITTLFATAFIASVYIGEMRLSFAVTTIVSLWLWHQMIEDDKWYDDFEKRLNQLEGTESE